MENHHQPQTPLAPEDTVSHSNKNPSLSMLLSGVALVTAIVAGGIGYYLGSMQKTQTALPEQEVQVSTKPETNQVACTMEAKICPDGSSVSRGGPNCEFAACPNEEIQSSPLESQKVKQEYKSTQFTYSFEHPKSWVPSRTSNDDGELIILSDNEKNTMEISAAKLPTEGLEKFLQDRVKDYEISSFSQNPQYKSESVYKLGGFPTKEISYRSMDGIGYVELFTQVRDEYFVRITTPVDELHQQVISSFELK